MEITTDVMIRTVLMMDLASPVYTMIEWSVLLTVATGTYQMRDWPSKETHYNVTL